MSKGQVLERLIARHPQHHPVFIGDDQTDEEGFAAVRLLEGQQTTSAPD
ncbi:MAG TPA: hypothetical protein VFS50_13810 [Meiothermus sp.]|nr:hypothetical protein [Meiothermus sp.]